MMIVPCHTPVVYIRPSKMLRMRCEERRRTAKAKAKETRTRTAGMNAGRKKKRVLGASIRPDHTVQYIQPCRYVHSRPFISISFEILVSFLTNFISKIRHADFGA
jgi:hypothetical protein